MGDPVPHMHIDMDNEGDGGSGGGESAPQEMLQQFGQVQAPPRMESRIHLISIIGQIEGHILLPPKNKSTKYEHIIPQLVAIEQNPRIQGVLLVLNTVGGDIEAGLAIAEMVRTLSKPTVTLVLGGGHSIGAPIAVAGTYSYIAETATITVHPIRLTGLVIGMPQTYDYLDKMQDRVVRFLVNNSRITEAKLRELMFRTGELVRDVGTVLVGAEAVKVGLIDEMGGLGDALGKLNELIRESEQKSQPVPETVKKDVPVAEPRAPGPFYPAPSWPAAPPVAPSGLQPGQPTVLRRPYPPEV